MRIIQKFIALLGLNSPSLIMFGWVFSAGISFLTAPIIARAIGPSGRGTTASILALFIIWTAIVGFGLSREVRRLAVEGNEAALVRSARILMLTVLPISSLVGVIVSFYVLTEFPLSTRLISCLGLSLSPLGVLFACDVSVLIVRHRFRSIFVLQIAAPIANLLFLSIMQVTVGLSVDLVLISAIVSVVGVAIFSAAFVRVRLLGERIPIWPLFRKSLGSAGLVIGETAIGRVDVMLLPLLVGASLAGKYSVAMAIATLPVAVGQALSSHDFAIIARQKTKSDRKAVTTTAIRVAVAAAILVIPIAALGAVILIPILFGQQYIFSVPLALAATFGTGAYIVALVANSALSAAARGGYASLMQCASVLVLALSLSGATQFFGVWGAIIATTFSYILLVCTLLFGLGINPKHIYPSRGDFVGLFRKLFRAPSGLEFEG